MDAHVAAASPEPNGHDDAPLLAANPLVMAEQPAAAAAAAPPPKRQKKGRFSLQVRPAGDKKNTKEN